MKKVITLFALALNFFLYAQPDAIDPTFNPSKGANNFIETTSIQSDGKIIIGGFFTTLNSNARN